MSSSQVQLDTSKESDRLLNLLDQYAPDPHMVGFRPGKDRVTIYGFYWCQDLSDFEHEDHPPLVKEMEGYRQVLFEFQVGLEKRREEYILTYETSDDHDDPFHLGKTVSRDEAKKVIEWYLIKYGQKGSPYIEGWGV